MKYFNATKPLRVKLTRDLTKHIKRGNPWIFGDAVEKLKAPEGSYGILMSHKNEVKLERWGVFCYVVVPVRNFARNPHFSAAHT